jgi:hypothetical protein
MQMESTENALRSPRPCENARNRSAIAPTSQIKIAASPASAYDSTNPPAIAPTPVALLFPMPTNMLRKPIIIGTHGTQASATPQKNRFCFTSPSIYFGPFPRFRSATQAGSPLRACLAGVPAKNSAHRNSFTGLSAVSAIFTAISATAFTIQ